MPRQESPLHVREGQQRQLHVLWCAAVLCCRIQGVYAPCFRSPSPGVEGVTCACSRLPAAAGLWREVGSAAARTRAEENCDYRQFFHRASRWSGEKALCIFTAVQACREPSENLSLRLAPEEGGVSGRERAFWYLENDLPFQACPGRGAFRSSGGTGWDGRGGLFCSDFPVLPITAWQRPLLTFPSPFLSY